MAESCTDCAPFTSHAGTVGQGVSHLWEQALLQACGEDTHLDFWKRYDSSEIWARLSLKGSLLFSSLLQGNASWDLLVFIHHSHVVRGNWYITLCTDVSTKVTKIGPWSIAADWSFSWSLFAADWLAERTMWDRFELISCILGESGYGVKVHFKLGAATNVIHILKVGRLLKQLHSLAIGTVIHFKHFLILWQLLYIFMLLTFSENAAFSADNRICRTAKCRGSQPQTALVLQCRMYSWGRRISGTNHECCSH